MDFRSQRYLNVQPVIAAAFGKFRYRRHVNQHIIQLDIRLNERAVANAAKAAACFRIGTHKVALRADACRAVDASGKDFGSKFRILKRGIDNVGFIFIRTQCVVTGSRYRALAHLHGKFPERDFVAGKCHVQINIVKNCISVAQFQRAAVHQHFAVNQRFFQRAGQRYRAERFAHTPLNHRR